MQLKLDISRWLDYNLVKVQKPGRYVGGELNQVVKNWGNTLLHSALVFPDIYDIGSSNLGLTILYEEINKRKDCLAERSFAPWVDMEQLLRKDSIPLFTLESHRPLIEFDLIGITLPYETVFTNVLNILSLSGIPIFSKDRLENHPLIIAGGNATTNPEPMSEFFEAFALGDGEELIHEVLNVLIAHKKKNLNRTETLIQLSRIEGIYVPRFYQVEYHPDGKIKSFFCMNKQVPDKIHKRIIANLPPPPSHLIVPNIKIVHNRIAIEIMRGCTRGCRFCHAGMINRPVRERQVTDIISSIDSSLKNTGYEEIALLSLSTSDYSQIQTLIEQIKIRYLGKHLSIALPSLRIESVSVDILDNLKGSRQGSFTLAPEAASEKLRNTINKPITSKELIKIAREIYNRGWLTIKLYFMIGNPGESIEDIQAIVDLCKQVLNEGKIVHKNRANLHVSINTFIPKPHTPFQWVEMESLQGIKEKQHILKRGLRIPGIRVNWSDAQESLLEAWLSRGDRRLTKVIYSAWKNGAKFDAWQDHFNFSAWQDAFQHANLTPEFFSHRERKEDEIFPWDHIDMGVSKDFLFREWMKSKTGRVTSDCRDQCQSCGIIPYFLQIKGKIPDIKWRCPEESEF
jgi:radical SAM family uncharacterized protein